jgi:hypothetical protein
MSNEQCERRVKSEKGREVTDNKGKRVKKG